MTPAMLAAPAPARAPAEGSIFPLGALAWAAPATSKDDPSLGLFKNETKVEILDRVSGPFGWDWLKVRGVVADGQTVEAFVRADLIAGTDIKPQPGKRCARDNSSQTYGRTTVYSRDVMSKMTGLRDSYPNDVITQMPPKTFFAIEYSLRARNGWEWHVVRSSDGREGVIRADQLRPAPATLVGDTYFCQSE